MQAGCFISVIEDFDLPKANPLISLSACPFRAHCPLTDDAAREGQRRLAGNRIITTASEAEERRWVGSTAVPSRDVPHSHIPAAGAAAGHSRNQDDRSQGGRNHNRDGRSADGAGTPRSS